MTQKRKKLEKWHSLGVDTGTFSAKDFECFGGIEELSDYTLFKTTKKGKLIKTSVHKNSSKSKKIKKRKTSVSVSENNEEPDLFVNENDEVEEDGNAEKPAVLQSEIKEEMSAWCNCFVPDDILMALKELGFTKPTPIQELALPAAIRDHQDIIGAAETGSGKTLAFGIPLITHILSAKDREKLENDNFKKLRGLILAPTRELAIQVKNHLQDVTKYVDIKITAVVGGMAPEKQRRLLKKHPDIVVATPGRLWELMEEDNPHLREVPDVRYLVIDEADRMVEHGHFAELLKILELLNANKQNKRRQTFVFSATLTVVHDLPQRLAVKAKKVKMQQQQKLGSLISLIGMKDKPKIIDITTKAAVVQTLTESQLFSSVEEKDIYLYYFLKMYPGRTLVFCNSIDCVRRLKSVFEHLQCHPFALHASMHQRQRLKNLENFAASENGLLLATDVAARGLDIKGINHVVHFQVPRTAEIYVHRSGRTARAQQEGLSLMLIEPKDVIFYKRICKTLNKDKSLPQFPVDHDMFKTVKERVLLARKIDQEEHRLQRLNAQNRWFLKAADEGDLDIDDENLINLGEEQQNARKAKQIKIMKKQLCIMLKKALVPRACKGRYPTLVKSVEHGSKNAIDIMKNQKKKKLKKKQCN